LAEQLKKEHALKYPNYTYKPRKPSEKKRRISKKKAAALASTENLEEYVDSSLSAEQELPDDELPIIVPSIDFTELTGAWAEKRTASLPASSHLPALISRHNLQNQSRPQSLPLVYQSSTYVDEHLADIDAIDWSELQYSNTNQMTQNQFFNGWANSHTLTVQPGEYNYMFPSPR
jgi:hypothetical protein